MTHPSKTIHPVFQVLNFLKSENSDKYDLLPADRFLLIILVSHSGNQGIYPSQKTLAKECKVSIKFLEKRISILKKKGLIRAEKIGRRNYYTIQIPLLQEGNKVINTPPIGAKYPSCGRVNTPPTGGLDSLYINNKEEITNKNNSVSFFEAENSQITQPQQISEVAEKCLRDIRKTFGKH